MEKIKTIKAETNFPMERIKFSWTVIDWKLCRELHESEFVSLVSPTFESSSCKWQIKIEFIFDGAGCFRTTYCPTNVTAISASLRLIECDNTIPSVVVSGTLQIGEMVESKIFLIHALSPSPPVSPQSTISSNSSFIPDPDLNDSLRYHSVSNKVKTPGKLKCDEIGSDLSIHVDFKISSGIPEAKILDSKCVASDFTTRPADSITDSVDDLSELFKNLLHDKKFTDMCVIIDGVPVKAHRFVVAYRSSVFKKMIQKATDKRQPMEFELDCSSIEVWNEFQEFLYTGLTSVADTKLLNMTGELFRLAKKYQVASLVNHVASRLHSVLSSDNVIDLYEIANQNDVEKLKDECIKVLKNSLEHIKKS